MQPPTVVKHFLGFPLLVLLCRDTTTPEFSIGNEFRRDFYVALIEFAQIVLEDQLTDPEYPLAKSIAEIFWQTDKETREGIITNARLIQNSVILNIHPTTLHNGTQVWMEIESSMESSLNSIFTSGVVGFFFGYNSNKQEFTLVVCIAKETVKDNLIIPLHTQLNLPKNDQLQKVANIRATKLSQSVALNEITQLQHKLGLEYGIFLQPLVPVQELKLAQELANHHGKEILFHLSDLLLAGNLATVTVGCVESKLWPSEDSNLVNAREFAFVIIYTLVSAALNEKDEARILGFLGNTHGNLKFAECAPMATAMARLRASLLVKEEVIHIKFVERVEGAYTWILPVSDSNFETLDKDTLSEMLEITDIRESKYFTGVGFGRKLIDGNKWRLVITFLYQSRSNQYFADFNYDPAGMVLIVWSKESMYYEKKLLLAGRNVPLPLGHFRTIHENLCEIIGVEHYFSPYQGSAISILFHKMGNWIEDDETVTIYLRWQENIFKIPMNPDPYAWKMSDDEPYTDSEDIHSELCQNYEMEYTCCFDG